MIYQSPEQLQAAFPGWSRTQCERYSARLREYEDALDAYIRGGPAPDPTTLFRPPA